MSDYRIFADYHTHTKYSDGSGSIEQNIQAGIAKGLTEIGITDHGTGCMFGLSRKQLPKIREEIDALNSKYDGQIKCYFGIEADLLSPNGDIDVLPADRKYYDYVLLGYHRFVHYKDGGFGKFFFNSFSSKGKQEAVEVATNAFIRAIERNDIHCISHPGDDLPVDLLRLTEACVETGTALELNSKHNNLDDGTIAEMVKLGANFLAGSDAHKPEAVGNFATICDIIDRINLPHERVLNLEEL